MLDILITTVIKRPYVLAFLLSYLFISTLSRGWIRTIIYLIIGYTIAWSSEVLSINYGFPYGLYYYVYENLQGEWLNTGVPVWDSVSYVFINYAGLCLAIFALKNETPRDEWIRSLNPISLLKLIALAAFLVTALDIVIDPLAHQGEKWFLGHIYYYAYPGMYFDVPISNFMGWYLVAFAINGCGIFMERLLPLKTPLIQRSGLHDWIVKFGGVGLYYGIYAFNLFIALYLKNTALIIASLAWGLITMGVVLWTIRQRRPQEKPLKQVTP